VTGRERDMWAWLLAEQRHRADTAEAERDEMRLRATDAEALALRLSTAPHPTLIEAAPETVQGPSPGFLAR
jgi:hypothetical protein